MILSLCVLGGVMLGIHIKQSVFQDVSDEDYD